MLMLIPALAVPTSKNTLNHFSVCLKIIYLTLSGSTPPPLSEKHSCIKDIQSNSAKTLA